jgi:1-acyl-sn-glycerol-3-phosphate acyltransferase
MMIQRIWFTLVSSTLKLGLFFYSKKIRVLGTQNIPKKGAVLFAVNHPNGLVDPLYVTTTNKRKNHFLVRAASFKKPFIKKILESLYLMPIYRIRDGIQQLGNNHEIFEKCHTILKNGETLMIFPEGSHDKKRTVRPLSKGFTRIVFGALEKYKELEIKVVPVGITYQHASHFPANVLVNYGRPISTRNIFKTNPVPKAIHVLKAEVRQQLEELSVHIPNDSNYNAVLEKLIAAQVNFTEVAKVNEMILNNHFPNKKAPKKNYVKPLYFLIILNSIVPYLLWKKAAKQVKEIEFIDTFRFTLNLLLFSIFYCIQAWALSMYFGNLIGFFYLSASAFMVLIYSKLAPTNAKKYREFNETDMQESP